ncbi:hypothetical protein PC117_g2751 [Phytophthora cactorum]|uniref:Uncharacterized protein n=1 Tax=Phytophthora cactorum TaxID=29920 RepID=A0A8T1ED88_9STRA|nr:hypothetical protein PC117_g2751 [Phytophthora cactorum]
MFSPAGAQEDIDLLSLVKYGCWVRNCTAWHLLKVTRSFDFSAPPSPNPFSAANKKGEKPKPNRRRELGSTCQPRTPYDQRVLRELGASTLVAAKQNWP